MVATHDDSPSVRHHKVPLEPDVHTDTELKTGRVVPIASFIALTLAGLSILAALGLLLAINHKEVWPNDGIYALVQPASILSLILSLIGLFIAFAYEDGLDYAWWDIQRKPNTEVDDLQNAHAAGDSLLSAIRYLFTWFRISTASLSIFLLTLNGFVLQGAITTRLYTQFTESIIQIPVTRQLDLGFSSPPSQTFYDTNWAQVWQQVLNVDGVSFSQYAFFGSKTAAGQLFDFGYNVTSVYDAEIEGAGFDVNCTVRTNSFDLTPSEDQDLTNGRIFSSLVTWDPSAPNEMRLSVTYKNTTECAGDLITKSCVLQAATVLYPVQVQMQLPGTVYDGPFYSLRRWVPGQIDKTISILPVYENEGVNNTWTYRGIGQSLAQTYNSSITVTSSYGTSSPGDLAIEGRFAFSLGPKYPEGWRYQCNMSFYEGLRNLAYFQIIQSNTTNSLVQQGMPPDQLADPVQVIIQRLRQAMFISSIYSGSSAFGSAFRFSNAAQNQSFQEVKAQQSTDIARYEVRLYLWAISVGITFFVILCMLPLFWKFWTMTRHPGSTPVDYARAFRKGRSNVTVVTPQKTESSYDRTDTPSEKALMTSSRLQKR